MFSLLNTSFQGSTEIQYTVLMRPGEWQGTESANRGSKREGQFALFQTLLGVQLINKTCAQTQGANKVKVAEVSGTTPGFVGFALLVTAAYNC